MATILLAGSSGMIGKGVLLECINSSEIRSVILVNRSPIDIQNAKITEIILEDFQQIDSIREQLGKPDACFHCMGVSAVGLSEELYSKFTYDITQKLADLCFDLNPEMTFNYVSGTGTDSSEKSRQMWARVKGRTENYILSKDFRKAYMFRPGFIIPEQGIRSRTKLYNNIYAIMRPFFPLLRRMKSITTTTKIGQAMLISHLQSKYQVTYLENKEINEIAGLKSTV